MILEHDDNTAGGSTLLQNLNPEQLAAVTLPAQAGADPGRRRLRQDARPHHAHRVAAADRSGVAGRRDGGHLHQQGVPRRCWRGSGHAADQRARHVDRHLPRPVQPLPARALEAGRAAAGLPDPRHRRFAVGRQARDQGDESRRGALRAQAGELVHRRRQGQRTAAAETSRSATSSRASRCRSTRPTRSSASARGVVDFAELLLRAFELMRDNEPRCASTTSVAFATSWSTSSRTPTAAVRVAQDVRRPADGAVFAVGDDDQSIYAFAARKWATWPTSSASSVSSRSSSLSRTTVRFGNILDAANELISATRIASARTFGPKPAPASRCACSKRPAISPRRSGSSKRRSSCTVPARRAPRSRCSIAATRSRA
jgi:DNA helicase-2/ATP-dependent DNA helicase PcrA